METKNQIISPFLYMFKSDKEEYLAYNGITNSFMKLNINLYDILLEAKNNFNVVNDLDKETYSILRKAKVICTQQEIDDAINQKKFLRQLDTFQHEYLNLTIAPTSACNFSCPYCFEKGIKYRTMNNKVVNALVDFISNKSKITNNSVSITWYGGEPLLAIDKIDKIITEIKNRGVKIIYNGIITNGYYLSKKNQEILKKHNIRFIQVTLDGANAETHNRRRFNKDGSGSWDTILKNLDILINDKDFDVDNVSIRCNIDKKNKDEYEKLKSELLKRWDNDKRLFIHSAILQDYNKDSNIECSYISDNEASEYLIKQARKEKNIPYFSYNIGGCSATRLNSYLVGPEGELYKCWNDLGRKDRVVGNIFNDKIENKELLFNFLASPTMFEDEACLKCPLFFVCDGGCQANRIDNYINNSNKNLCHFSKGYLDKYLSAYYELKKQEKKFTFEKLNI